MIRVQGVTKRWGDFTALDDVSLEVPEGGVWIAPGSPYRSMDGMLAGIQFARARNRPFVAT